MDRPNTVAGLLAMRAELAAKIKFNRAEFRKMVCDLDHLATNAVVPIIVLLLEAVILFILANRMGIEEVKGLFERLIHGVTRSGTGGG